MDVPPWAHQLVEILTYVGTAVLAGLAGWLTKHRQSLGQEGDAKPPKRDELRDALLAPHPLLGINAVEQIALTTRYVSYVDADGARVSLLREIFRGIEENGRNQTAILDRIERMLELTHLDGTWTGEERRGSGINKRTRKAGQDHHGE